MISELKIYCEVNVFIIVYFNFTIISVDKSIYDTCIISNKYFAIIGYVIG